MAKRKWNRRQNSINYYLFPSQEPLCKKDEKIIDYERVFNQCLTRGYGGSACESFCLINTKTHEIFEIRQFYKENYLLSNGRNGGNGYKRRKPYCSHHDYDIRKEKGIKKCLTCGPNNSMCGSFYIKNLTTSEMINPRAFYKEEFLDKKV